MLCALDASGSSAFHLFHLFVLWLFVSIKDDRRVCTWSAVLLSRWKGRSKVLTIIREKARTCSDFAQEHKRSNSTLTRLDGTSYSKQNHNFFQCNKNPKDLFLALPSPAQAKRHKVPRTLALSLAMHPKINRPSSQRLIPCQILSGFYGRTYPTSSRAAQIVVCPLIRVPVRPQSCMVEIQV